MIEAIEIVEGLTGRPMQQSYDPHARAGDHQWWISDTRRFETDYPQWRPSRSILDMIREIHNELTTRDRPAGE